MFAQHSPSKKVVCFSCSGPDSVSLLRNGYFQQLLNFDENLIDESALKSCENHITSFSVFNSMRQTFMKIKQKFHLVKDTAIRNFDCFNKESDFHDDKALRMDILKIFHIYLINLQKLNSGYHNQINSFSNFSSENSHLKNIVIQLTSEIKHLLICVGRLSSVPDINTISDFSDTSKSATSFYNFFHLCLDIWFNCLSMLYMMHFSVPIEFKETFCDFIEHSSAFLQVASFLVFDLSFLSINRYMNLHKQTDAPFVCPCIKDLWIMLIKFCDRHNEREMFWNIFLSNLQIILKKTSQDVKDITIDKFSIRNINANSDSHKLIESCLWLTSHVASLCKHNMLGDISEYERFTGGSVVGKYLIDNLLSDSEIFEKHLCNCLPYCIELSKLWGASADISFPLIEFYIPKINKTFSLQEISFSYLFKDAKTWFVYIQNLSNLVPSNKETSFDYFLSILSLQLQFDKDGNLWRALRGRFYSKFSPKKVKEMQETGLQNFFSLYLILVLSGQSEVVNKICEAVSVVEKLTIPRKQQISWKAMFVLLRINQAKKCDSGKITKLLSEYFKSVCADYSKISHDSNFKSNLMDLLLVYIVNTKDIFESSNGFSSTTYQLISTGFSDLLKSCSLSDQNYILQVILNILQNIQKNIDLYKIDYVVTNTECIKTLQFIFDNIYPLIETIVTTETVPLVISDIAVILTELTFTFSTSINSMDFDYCKIFMFFACKDTVNSDITCRYISLIYDHPQIIKEIKLRYVDLDVLVFQSWLKCLISMQIENKNLEELTKKILHLPIINEIVPNFKVSYEIEHVIDMVYVLFTAIGNDFTRYNMPEKIIQARKVQPLFKNYASLVENKIHKNKESPTFSQIMNYLYKITSLLIENCSSVLHYRVSSESVLLQILDRIVYPQILFAKESKNPQRFKAYQKTASYAIKEHLPRFMKGLFKLDYRKDKSIESRIRNIFIYYIEALPLGNNPLIKLFSDSFNQKSGGLDLDACLFILESLKSSLLNSIENPESILSIFIFYLEIFQKSPPNFKKNITNIILQCAMDIFMGRTDSICEFLKGQIKNVLTYFKDKDMQSETKEIIKPVIMWFIQEKLQWAIVRGFTLLDLFVDNVPQVMLDLVKFLKNSIETLERNRGLGEDKLLRNGFQNIITKLQLKLNKSSVA